MHGIRSSQPQPYFLSVSMSAMAYQCEHVVLRLALQMHLQLMEFIQLDDTGTALLARKAAVRWSHWPLSAAFTGWSANAAEQVLERTNERRASTFLYFALTLKALTGFKWAVQEAKEDAAAGAHRQAVTKRQVFRAWKVAAVYIKASGMSVFRGGGSPVAAHALCWQHGCKLKTQTWSGRDCQ